MDNRPLATSSYKEALKLDVYCFEAFDLLTSHHMLTAQEGEADLWRRCALTYSFSTNTCHLLLFQELVKMAVNVKHVVNFFNRERLP